MARPRAMPDSGRMAEPTYWQPVDPADRWDPVLNNDKVTGDWVELGPLDGGEAPAAGTVLARDDAAVKKHGLIPAAKEYDAHRKFVGVAWADTASPWRLRRINPLPHPKNWQLRCATADLVPFVPRPVNQTVPPADPVYHPYTVAPYLASTPDGPDGLKAARLPGELTYHRMKATLTFRPVPYPVLEDKELEYTVDGVPYVLPEIYRNTTVFEEVSPSLDVLLTDPVEPWLAWADSAASGPPTAGESVPGQIPEYVQRAALKALWVHVPQEFIIPAGGFLPTKIMNAVGKVNSSTWYGFPEGTLRLEAPVFRRYVQAAVRVLPTSYTVPFVYDVLFPFSWVDVAPAAILGGGTPGGRGWNLFPFSSTGKWYAVKRKTSGTPYFPGYDFNKLFEHVGAP